MRTAPWVAALMAAFLVACGQKGPLVLPDAQHPHKKLGVPKPAAGSQPAAPSSPAADDAGGAKSNPATQQ